MSVYRPDAAVIELLTHFTLLKSRASVCCVKFYATSWRFLRCVRCVRLETDLKLVYFCTAVKSKRHVTKNSLQPPQSRAMPVTSYIMVRRDTNSRQGRPHHRRFFSAGAPPTVLDNVVRTLNVIGNLGTSCLT